MMLTGESNSKASFSSQRIELRKESLLNEYKGNLFEFLVALELSKACDSEAFFLKHLSDDFKVMLRQQEVYIRTYYADLLMSLQSFSEDLAQLILKKMLPIKLESFFLIGKTMANNMSLELAETDIIAFSNKKKRFLLSIKLNKYKASVNTKSAGVKSFFTKYFKVDEHIQDKINSQVDLAFKEFSFALHEENAVDWDEHFVNWCEKGLATLPGELEDKSRQFYLNFLAKCSDIFYEQIKKLSKLENFVDQLFPLLGFGNSEIIQATCFHSKNYEKSIMHVVSKKELATKNYNFVRHPQTSYFEILFDSIALQIRIKAMNKFTHKSFKVNCSVRQLA